MKLLKNCVVIIIWFFALMFFVGVIKKFVCIGESSGTMVVIGGTSTRCE